MTFSLRNSIFLANQLLSEWKKPKVIYYIQTSLYIYIDFSHWISCTFKDIVVQNLFLLFPTLSLSQDELFVYINSKSFKLPDKQHWNSPFCLFICLLTNFSSGHTFFYTPDYYLNIAYKCLICLETLSFLIFS